MEASSPSSPSSPLTDAQEKALAILPLFSVVLSVLGSAAILRLTLRRPKPTSYERILFGLSVSDIASSMTNALGAFLVPRDSSHRIWAVGTDATCKALGTAYQITQAGFMYSGMLSLYFLLTIRFGMSNQTFAKYVEPAAHMSAAAGPSVTAMLGLYWDVYGEVRLGPGCWTVPDREYGEMFGWIATAVPMALTVLGVLGGQILIVLHCRQVLSRSISHQERWSSSASGGSDHDNNKRQRLRNVTIQSVSYVAVFLAVNLWPIVVRILDNEGVGTEASLYPLLVLQAIFLPIQGFGNCVIYVRPRYRHHRQRHPDESITQTLLKILWYDDKGSTNRRMNYARNRQTSNLSMDNDSGIGLGRRRLTPFVGRGRSRSFDDGYSSSAGTSSHHRRRSIRRMRSRSLDSMDTFADLEQPQ